MIGCLIIKIDTMTIALLFILFVSITFLSREEAGDI
jgi:hypothetical protein